MRVIEPVRGEDYLALVLTPVPPGHVGHLQLVNTEPRLHDGLDHGDLDPGVGGEHEAAHRQHGHVPHPQPGDKVMTPEVAEQGECHTV